MRARCRIFRLLRLLVRMIDRQFADLDESTRREVLEQINNSNYGKDKP